jgi:thymidine phosphorylase
MNTLKLKRIAIDTYKENVVYLHRDCDLYQSQGFQALNKIEVYTETPPKQVFAVLNVVDGECIIAPNEIGLSEQVFKQFNQPEGSPIKVRHATQPKSLSYVHRKISGDRLNYSEYFEIIQDINANRYSKIEITAYLVGCAESEMDRDEVLYLTQAMINTGERIDWNGAMVADKHCIGGIPGNRTSLLIMPIVASYGLLMPKTSSRAITSPAGSADTMEALANVELDIVQLKQIVKQHGGCLAWGGTAKLAPVDDILITVERPLSMDSSGQMVASILSKKLSAGVTHLIIDIPVGPTAKMHSYSKATKLRKLFEYVGDNLGLHLEVIMTDGKQPIGSGVGPNLEARDIMRVLENSPQASQHLREKALQLSGRIIEFDNKVRAGQGYAIAREILESGRALEKFNTIIDAQGRNPEPLTFGTLTFDVASPITGHVSAINNFVVAHIARLAGAPIDKGAGIEIHKKIDDHVVKGEPLYTIYAKFEADFTFAQEAAALDSGFAISHSEINS